MCGEQYISILVLIRDAGSPPRVRGTALLADDDIKTYRITPACAGNSCHKAGGRGQQQDHPRVCGEQFMFLRKPSTKLGSPPRVRGTAGAEHLRLD